MTTGQPQPQPQPVEPVPDHDEPDDEYDTAVRRPRER